MKGGKQNANEKPYRGTRMEIPGEYPGEVIHVSKAIFEGVLKKANLISMRSVGVKVIIEYKSRKTGNRGVLELYDIGPKL